MDFTSKWDDLSQKQQYKYLQRHRKSKRRPTAQPESETLSEVRQSMGKLNSMVEGKEHIVKQKAEQWINKLQELGFEETSQDNNTRTFRKDDIVARISVDKGKMRYFAHFDIKQEDLQIAKIVDRILKESALPGFTLKHKDFVTMPKRQLGKTNLMVTSFGLGGQGLLEIENKGEAAADMINKALDLGVTYFDTAAMYGPSRKYLGRVLRNKRKDVVIASKVDERSYEKAKKQLNETFGLLKTDYIDIMQLHAITDEKDKEALGENGALKALTEARDEGKIGYIGFSGHDNKAIMLDFIDAFDFDTILLPVNPVAPEMLDVIEAARNRGMGIIGMKVMSKGILSKAFPPDKLLQYAMNYADTVIVGCMNEEHVENNVEASNEFKNKKFKFKMSDKLKDKASFFLGSSSYNKKEWPTGYEDK